MTAPRPPFGSDGGTAHGPPSTRARHPSDATPDPETAPRQSDAVSAPETIASLTRDDRWSRRGFLGGVGLGIAALAVGGTGVAGADTNQSDDESGTDNASEHRVLTRNLSLGVDFSRLASAQSTEDLPRVVGSLLADIDASHPEERVRAVADEIVATDPAVVGLQEVALVRTERPADSADGTTDAETVRYDFLATLQTELEERGADYRVAVSGATTDLEAPGAVDGERVDVRLTDRDVILARADVSTSDPRSRVYDSSLVLPVGEERTIGIARGFVAVDVEVDGRTFTVANTHLEAASSLFRRAQAGELSDRVDGDAVVLGDLNSRPGEDAYDLLTRSFDDVWAVVGPDEGGDTCCQDGDLRNETSDLTRRIDHVLVRGLDAVSATRVGATEDDRIEVDGARLWPSDHAGVLATLRLPDPPADDTTDTSVPSDATNTGTASTSTPTTDAATGETTGTNTTSTGDPTDAPDPSGTDDGASPNPVTEASAPGFSVVGALAALLAASALATRRSKKE